MVEHSGLQRPTLLGCVAQIWPHRLTERVALERAARHHLRAWHARTGTLHCRVFAHCLQIVTCAHHLHPFLRIIDDIINRGKLRCNTFWSLDHMGEWDCCAFLITSLRCKTWAKGVLRGRCALKQLNMHVAPSTCSSLCESVLLPCSSLCCCPAQTHRAGQAGRDAASLREQCYEHMADALSWPSRARRRASVVAHMPISTWPQGCRNRLESSYKGKCPHSQGVSCLLYLNSQAATNRNSRLDSISVPSSDNARRTLFNACATPIQTDPRAERAAGQNPSRRPLRNPPRQSAFETPSQQPSSDTPSWQPPCHPPASSNARSPFLSVRKQTFTLPRCRVMRPAHRPARASPSFRCVPGAQVALLCP